MVAPFDIKPDSQGARSVDVHINVLGGIGKGKVIDREEQAIKGNWENYLWHVLSTISLWWTEGCWTRPPFKRNLMLSWFVSHKRVTPATCVRRVIHCHALCHTLRLYYACTVQTENKDFTGVAVRLRFFDQETLAQKTRFRRMVSNRCHTAAQTSTVKLGPRFSIST